MCFLMYTSGDEAKFDCMQRTVCEDPYLASDYLTAAKMWYKMHNMLKSIVPFSEKYSKIMYAVQEASEYGRRTLSAPTSTTGNQDLEKKQSELAENLENGKDKGQQASLIRGLTGRRCL